MPTTAVHTWTGKKLEPALRPDLAVMIPVAMTPALSGTNEYLQGTVLGRIDATGKYSTYDPDSVSGTQTAIGILAYDISVDTSGLIVFTETAAAASEIGVKSSSVGMYIAGYFNGADLDQSGDGSLDADAVSDLGGRFINGDLSNGIFAF